MLVFTDKEQDTPGVVEVTAVTVTNAMVSDRLTTLIESLRVSPVMVGQASRVPSTIHANGDIPAIEGTFTCASGPCSLVYYGQRGRCHGHDRDAATRFPEAGKALRLWTGCFEGTTTSSSVSGWMKLRATARMRATIPSGPSQRVDSRSPRTTWTLSKVQRRIAVPQSGPIIRRGAGCRFSMATPI